VPENKPKLHCQEVLEFFPTSSQILAQLFLEQPAKTFVTLFRNRVTGGGLFAKVRFLNRGLL